LAPEQNQHIGLALPGPTSISGPARLAVRFPRKKNYQLLKTLRDDILAYLVWVTDELAQGDMGQASAEIERAAERLRNIAMLMPAARASATSDDLEETITPVWRK
jgi:hypothetical protein